MVKIWSSNSFVFLFLFPRECNTKRREGDKRLGPEEWKRERMGSGWSEVRPCCLHLFKGNKLTVLDPPLLLHHLALRVHYWPIVCVHTEVSARSSVHWMWWSLTTVVDCRFTRARWTGALQIAVGGRNCDAVHVDCHRCGALCMQIRDDCHHWMDELLERKKVRRGRGLI